jgi:hypothetical protein
MSPPPHQPAIPGGGKDVLTMMSFNRNLSYGDGDSPVPAARAEQREGWMDRYLPPRGIERVGFFVVVALTLALKVLAIYHFRADSDETQHAHVVWQWVTGKLMYRDYFDNHMPLFQMLCAPLMALLGERADIMIPLRWAMVPMYFVSLWSTYRLTEILYSRRAAAWCALFAAVAWKFFYTSTEFRTDQLWTAFWLLSLVVAVGGEFTVRRAFMTGLVMGLAGAVSVKTTPLVVALTTVMVPALGLAWGRGVRPPIGGMAGRIGATVAGCLIAPAAVIFYFVREGAFWNMYYCVIAHNIVPGLKRWGNISLHQWYFPVSLPLMGTYAWLIFRQTPDTRLAIRRTIIALLPWCYLCLLLSYWPDITREDDLPYVPLVPVSLIPLITLIGSRWPRKEAVRAKVLTYGLPVMGLALFFVTLRAHNIIEDRLYNATYRIGLVLKLTNPDDYVMDTKGTYVYRQRAYYWVLEPLTKARLRSGLIHDSMPQRITEKGAKICYFFCARDGSVAAHFIVSNYVPFDPQAEDLGILGKVIGKGPEGGTFAFYVTIPQTYAVTTESGTVEGELDGKPYTGPVWMGAGSHVFRRTGGSGRVGIILGDAHSKGYSPLYDAADHLEKDLGKLAKGKKKAELQ